MESLACSFKNLSKISNLWGLDKLVKLQLDNNRIEKIENLSHLVGEQQLRSQTARVHHSSPCALTLAARTAIPMRMLCVG